MTQFRPQHSSLPPRPEPAAIPQPPDGSPAWADCLAATIQDEIDQGMIVRVQLPRPTAPVLVEDAVVWGGVGLAILDPQGGRYFVTDPAGLVVISQPLEPGMTAERALRGQADLGWMRQLDER